ncbi:hypothetical protein DFH06DRAFT_1127014 [Mycena polygramma]|nr:hypothetical protein DFH06DRAFT_1127014 [Mycena polygramma]
MEAGFGDPSVFSACGLLGGPTTQISCHIVIKEAGKKDIDQVFTGIACPGLYLVQRQNCVSISIATLTAALEHELASNRIPARAAAIRQVLNGSHPMAANITVATTRVPDFGEATYTNALNGYRLIDNLTAMGTLDIEAMIPGADFDNRIDILAAAGRTNPAAAQFFDMWEAMGIVPASHFILLYIVGTIPPLYSASSESSLPTNPRPRYSQSLIGFGAEIGASNSPDFQQPRFTPSPSSVSSFLPIFTSPTTARSRDSTPSSSPSRQQSTTPISRPLLFLQPNSVSPSRTSRISRTPRTSRTLRSSAKASPPTSPPVIQDEQLFDLLRERIADFDSLKSVAMFQAGRRASSFTVLARRFYAMERIISALSIDAGSTFSSCTLTTKDGKDIQVTVGRLLEVHGWQPGTFSTKRNSYRDASLVAKRVWKSTVPGIYNLDILHSTMGQSFLMYKSFEAIRFLWREDGPLDPLLGNFKDPSADSTVTSERWAAKFKQVHLNDCEDLFDIYTDPPPGIFQPLVGPFVC